MYPLQGNTHTHTHTYVKALLGKKPAAALLHAPTPTEALKHIYPSLVGEEDRERCLTTILNKAGGLFVT